MFKLNLGKAELIIKTGDISAESVDCIVNAANESLSGSEGVCGAIHDAAGWDELYEAAQTAMRYRDWDKVPCGESVLTSPFKLKRYGVKYIVHTVGPTLAENGNDCQSLLEACFKSSLDLVDPKGRVKSIAYPLISTGIFGVPIETFADAAGSVLKNYEFQNINQIKIIVYGNLKAEKILKEMLI